MKLLVDADEFMVALTADIEAASDSVLAQTMTFEGDVAGRTFANLLIRGGCRDRRLIVDAYSRHILSCRWLHSPSAIRDVELRAEIRATRAAHEALARGGVGVRIVNPAGFLLRRLPARSHKKSVVVDGRIAYLGGLNFSDHNFCWHDLMLRIDDGSAASFLAEDLDASWRGQRIRGWRECAGVSIGLLDGRDNARDFEPVLDLVAGACDQVLIETAYLTFPFMDRLRDAARRGVHVVVIAPASHKTPGFAPYLQWECARSGFELRLLPGMTHVKAMLVDGRRLVLGSSNFDYLSYRVLQEILAIVDDPVVVADFVARVAVADLARARRAPPIESLWAGNVRRLGMHVAGAALAHLSAG
jgi:cardiolipin synthase